MIDERAQQRLKAIHALSQRYNEKEGVPHTQRLLELMRHHVVEIQELLALEDKHALVETGDLLILCVELLLEYGVSPDEMLNVCMGRYEKKLGELTAQQEKNEA